MGVMPTRCLNNRVKCAGYLKPGSKAIWLMDLFKNLRSLHFIIPPWIIANGFMTASSSPVKLHMKQDAVSIYG